MKPNEQAPKDNSRLGPLDYVLMGVGGSLAVYCGCMSVSNSSMATVFVVGTMLGTLISLAIRTVLANSLLLKVDGILYAGATLSAIFLVARLNTLLPAGGFPREVITAGLLCWMILFGSALTWRDGTLLFQAVPSIALFGLIGCYDTFKPAPFFFFGFMLCLATLLGRAHSREMLRKAVLSGYFNRADAPNTPAEYPEQSPELFADIKRGPWRMLAGPEWALGSALAVIAISVVGAPVIRAGVEPLTTAVKVATPTFRPTTVQAGPSSSLANQRVGKGPLSNLSEKPVYEAQMRPYRMRYFRMTSYDRYLPTGWSWSITGQNTSMEWSNVPDTAFSNVPEENKQPFQFRIRTVGNNQSLFPLPQQTRSLERSSRMKLISAGNVTSASRDLVEIKGTGFDVMGTPTSTLIDLPQPLLAAADTSNITSRVRDFFSGVVENKKSDYERAQAVKSAIEQQSKYNLKAPAVPDGEDPVEYFLFNSKEGYCDLFASSMVIGARSVGIPARYVVGFLPEQNLVDAQGNVVLREADYHAWAELFFKGFGWVVFDATEGAQQVPGAERGKPTANWTSAVRFDLATILNILIGLAVLGFGGYWLLGLRGRTLGKPSRSDLERLFLQFEKAVQRSTGQSRQPGMTATEFLNLTTEKLGSVGPPAKGIVTKLESALYGPNVPEEDSIRALKVEVADIIKQIRDLPKK